MITIYGYSKCSTVKKALKFLDENEVAYVHIDNVENKLTATQIESFHKTSGLPIKSFFNTSGILYREMNLKDVVKTISDKDAYELLSTNGMLVKRPIFVGGETVLVGFKVEKWEEVL